MLEAFGKGASLDMRAAKEELYRRVGAGLYDSTTWAKARVPYRGGRENKRRFGRYQLDASRQIVSALAAW